MSFQEKRKSHRISVELPAAFNLPDSPRPYHQATTVNVSANGFCIMTQEVLKLNTEIILTVEIEKDVNAQLKTAVVWNKKIGDEGTYMVGLRITDPSGEDFERFLNFYVEYIQSAQDV